MIQLGNSHRFQRYHLNVSIFFHRTKKKTKIDMQLETNHVRFSVFPWCAIHHCVYWDHKNIVQYISRTNNRLVYLYSDDW